MGKKVIGLAVTVALLTVVLSGCFLLPKPDTMPPTVTIISPQNGTNIVVTDGTANITVKASVTAHSPIQYVTFTLTSNSEQYRGQGKGNYGETSGVFSYTFTNLKPGTYSLSVEAYSKAKYPGYANGTFTIGVAMKNPVIGDIMVKPNYSNGYFVTSIPITFWATVTNPNNTGTLNVTATVNGNAAQEVSSNNGVYTFTYIPTVTGNAQIVITATVGTNTTQKSKTIEIYEKPAVTITKLPADYSVAISDPSFTFTTQGSVTAYLDVNGSTHAPYQSGAPITNLVPDEWNSLTLTFEGLGKILKTVNVHVLGTRKTNPNDTPYVFLIDKEGHVVNTNDWITVNAGDKIDLYGYILQGKNSIQNYDVEETYYPNENLTTTLYGPASVASKTNLNESAVPLRLVAYLFNEEATDTFIKFDIDVNNSAAAFLRYDVKPVGANSVSINVSPAGDTYEGVPETLNVTVESKQPITSIEIGQPKKIGNPFDSYATTTAYSNSQNNTNVMTFSHSYIVPVNDVVDNGLAAYGTASGTFPFKVAFYGPSGTYGIGATVTAIANQSAYATTTYQVQADTAAPTIKIKNGTNNSAVVEVNGTNVRVYYGPMTVTATITDDHAIYWATFESTNAKIASPTIIRLPNNAIITNYGATTITKTATVEFSGTGPFTIWAKASDKHFDPTHFWTGNTANSVNSIKGIYDNNAPTVSLVGGRYDIDATSEYYSFTIEATDGNGIGLADAANIVFTPVNGGTPVTVSAQLDPQAPEYYKVLVNTDKLENIRYSVAVTVMDKLYNLIPSSATNLKAEHETTVETGYVTVHHNYPKVAIFVVNGNSRTQLSSTPMTISNDVFEIRISDPQFPWDWVDNTNYKNYVQIMLAGPDKTFNPMTTLLAKYHTPGATYGYLKIEVPEIYFNEGNSSTPATVTMQVDVYDSIQPDKALFGRATAKFVPTSLFAQEPVVTFGGNPILFGTATPVVTTVSPTIFNVKFQLVGWAQNNNMEITFYANGTEVGKTSASATTCDLKIPIEPDVNSFHLTAVYTPKATVTYTAFAQSANDANYYSYSYEYSVGNFVIFGDTLTPMATISVNGQNITGSSTVVTSANGVYSLEGAAFYAHDYLSKYSTDLGMNTTVNGQITLTTSNGQTLLATPTLEATETLDAAGFNKAGEYVITKNLTTMASAGIYNVQFTANDPWWGLNTTANATIAVDLVPPTIDYSTPDVAPLGVVPSITDGETLSFSATDDAGVACVKASLENYLYGSKTTPVINVAATGIGIFNTTATMTVSLPTYVGAQFQNLPYILTITAKDVGNHATTLTRLLVTNIDHSPSVSKFILKSAKQFVVRLPEPMWVNNFKLFTAYSTTFGGTITSTNIQPVTVLATYDGQTIANEFVITFNSDIWNDPTGTNEWGDLSNVHMLDASNNPITDLAGNIFIVPVSHTIIPPTLNVTPLSTVVGPSTSVTFTITASSAAGIKQTIGYFVNQTKVLNTPSGQLTFTSPAPDGTVTTYHATFVTTDKSLDANESTQTATIIVNSRKPTVSASASPIVAYGATLTVKGTATVGSVIGSNVIIKVKVEVGALTVEATFTPNTTVSWNATLLGLEAGTNTITVTAYDKFGNENATTLQVYVDNTVPNITVTFTASKIADNATTVSINDETTGTLYVATPATFLWDITTPSGATPEVNVNISTLATGNTSPSSSVAVSASNTYTISVVATNPIDGKTSTFVATRTVIIDNVPPIATIIATPPSTVTAASPTAIATYTIYDSLSGVATAEITISSTSGSTLKVLPITSFGTDLTKNLLNALTNLPILINKATTVYLTVKAEDKVGNVTTSSTETLRVNLTFSITNATITNNELVITFNAPVDETTVASDDILLYNTSTGTLTATTYTVNSTVITVDKVVDNQGTTWSVGLLPAGTYTLTVNNVKSLTTEISLSNSSTTVTK